MRSIKKIIRTSGGSTLLPPVKFKGVATTAPLASMELVFTLNVSYRAIITLSMSTLKT